MKATATTQLQNKPFSGVVKHVEHDKKRNHSNQNINENDTQFNLTASASAEYITRKTAETFLPELKIYNQKQIESRHKSNVKTLEEYVKNKKWSKRAIATFGNSELQTELLKGKNEAERADFLQKESEGLLNYAKAFNRENSHFKVFKAVTNVDENKEEVGAPHVHLDVRPMSRTKTGKASMNINNALRAEYEHDNPNQKIPKDTRELMSWWREKNDQLLVKEMSKTLGIEFTLERKERDPKDVGLSMEDFQKRQDNKKETTELLAELEPSATIKWQKNKSKEEVETKPVSTEAGKKEAQSAPLGAIWARLNQASSYLREKTKKRLEKLREQIEFKREQLVQRRNDWLAKTRTRIKQTRERIGQKTEELRIKRAKNSNSQSINRQNEPNESEKETTGFTDQIDATRERIKQTTNRLNQEKQRERRLNARDQQREIEKQKRNHHHGFSVPSL